MKARQRKSDPVRRAGRKKARGRIGWRVLLVYIVTLMIAGALATAVNLKMEEANKAHEASSNP